MQVNGIRITGRQLLQHGDEISLGHAAAIDGHDVRWVYRSVGGQGEPLTPMVFDRYQITRT
jgi:pSer/pThr/pTyr-binding forkhead associated (FHA) protein